MRFFRFDRGIGREITNFGSKNVSISPILRNINTIVGCLHLSENSVLGMHKATCPQLFLVIEGEGWVQLPNREKVAVQKGIAVFWDEGEEHESGSSTGMTAIVIEGAQLDPSIFLKEIDCL